MPSVRVCLSVIRDECNLCCMTPNYKMRSTTQQQRKQQTATATTTPNHYIKYKLFIQ